ncbi:MAG TPA: hypothetical protein VHG09_02950 [Longimicrobiales bacterium]|nr:hypothetical protein [Longimicrobiales bacterium]
MVRSRETLRRRVLRFTGSRKATRVIMNRIEDAQRLGQIMSCMVLPRADAADSEYGDEFHWDVRVSYAAAGSHGGRHA